ncbi:MAG: hypothetical protein AB1452_18130, partial [Pseudomonadota bacterium]
PLSAIVGRREGMEIFDEIFFSGTFGGEAVSLAACRATLRKLERTQAIPHIWKVGQQLIDGLNALVCRHGLQDAIKVLGYAPRSVVAFPHSDEREARVRRSFFMQECVRRGLLYFCSHIPTLSHGDAEIRFTLDVLSEVVALYAEAQGAGDFERRLAGPPVEAIFRRA